ncbi:hypothetical protein SAMN05216241_11243 [Limimonas halophila]|uniref:Uncharacterized protein n=1 Tax=Limimonas halophila TaxID=1082479 RepID=A0A1G7U6Q1_9PROT|nr:hypothetical protein [Limimonas halophila]SDG43335.1 hypothetical protein SAMN05216241_11243 [Limimonas halophila]
MPCCAAVRTNRRRAAGRGLALVLAAVLAAGVAGPVHAQTTKPKHVHRLAETMLAELELLYRADLRDFELPEVPEVSGRKPRHVLMEVRRVYESTQRLRYLNGLERRSLDPVPVRHVRPADVGEMAERTLKQLRTLRKVYGIEAEVERPALRDGIVPSDVYVEVRKVQAALRGLGVPAIVPNDVYRRAQMLANELDKLAEHFGVPGRQPVEEPSSGKTPAQVYKRVAGLAEHMRAVVASAPDLSIPGGVTPSPEPPETPTPADVLALVRLLLADTTAIKAELGIDSPAAVPDRPVGRTPSDVYDVVRVCGEMLNRIEAKLTAG